MLEASAANLARRLRQRADTAIHLQAWQIGKDSGPDDWLEPEVLAPIRASPARPAPARSKTAGLAGSSRSPGVPGHWATPPARRPEKAVGSALRVRRGCVKAAFHHGDRAPRGARSFFEAATYLNSARMLWLFWLAIDSACVPSCCCTCRACRRVDSAFMSASTS
jgi:hypothetical protein